MYDKKYQGLLVAVSSTLIALIFLNLNSFFTALGLPPFVSLAILGLCAWLGLAGSVAVSRPLVLWSTAILSYLGIGLLASMVSGKEVAYQECYRWSASLVTIYAGYCMAGVARSVRARRQLFLVFVVCLFLGSLSVFFTNQLPQAELSRNLATGFQDRATGIWGNPNELAFMGVALVLLSLLGVLKVYGDVAYRLISYRLIWVPLGLVGFCAVLMPLSKTGLLCLLISAPIYFVLIPKGRLLLFALFCLIGIGAPFAWEHLEDLSMGNLGMMRRMENVMNLLSVTTGEDVSTGRLELWIQGWELVKESFLIGSGLGQLGGTQEYNFGLGRDALGVHNTFLLFWGESGIVPVLLLIIAMGATTFAAFRLRDKRMRLVAFVYVFYLFVDLMFTHNALTLRYHNLIMGFMLGLAALEQFDPMLQQSRKQS